MKCAKCGAELKLGCIYCSACGQEAQIVSESNLLEDELLSDLLKEDSVVTEQPEQKKKVKKKKKNNTVWIILICFFIIVTAIGIGSIIVVNIQNKNNNSYDYQMKKAMECYTEKNYVKSLEYYKQAISLKENDIAARHRMVEVYLLMEEEKAAIRLLHEIITIAPLEAEAYQLLIDLYDENRDYEAILNLKDTVKDDELQKLFSDYEALPPVFNMESGIYADYITVELSTPENDVIYYTTDGSNPIEMGKRYEKPFEMNEQKTLAIRAVCCNEYGIYSNIVTGMFTVKFKKPKMPIAVPDNGTFVAPTTVELVGIEESKIYYTWDGSTPTMESEEYTQPIEIPEGDHILSVILIDKYGMMSDVLKCNYKYLPSHVRNVYRFMNK